MSLVEKVIASSEAEQVRDLFENGVISEEEYRRSLSDLAFMLTGME